MKRIRKSEGRGFAKSLPEADQGNENEYRKYRFQ